VIVLSHYQAGVLLEARKKEIHVVAVSPDLGLTTVTVTSSLQGVEFPSGEYLSWHDAGSICEQQNNCFILEDGDIRKIQFFSEETSRAYSLYPTSGAPTMLISGIPMHRIKDTDPHRDTLEKIKTIQPLAGQVLDTATGLGYTAIQAARAADHVITIELDPVALESLVAGAL
jgi:predicted methyltransferase